MFESVSISDLKRNKYNNLIDIRNSEKFNAGHIYNAINIPFLNLLSKYDKYLKKEEKYYIYCQRGIQSKKASAILNAQGYNVVNVNGGYEAWLLNE